MPNIHCVVESRAQNEITFTWWFGPDCFKPYTFSGATFRILNEAADNCRTVFAAQVLPTVRAYGADTLEARAEYRLLAAAGADLRNQLFEPHDGAEHASRVSDWLRELRTTAPTDDPVVIEIVNEADHPIP